jgi:predicted kinase
MSFRDAPDRGMLAHARYPARRSNRKRVVLVSGAPGSGKTTVAVPLAAELGFPLLSKDIIKEQLFDAPGEGDGDPLSWSRRLGAASMELIWTLARHFPQAILEANFRPHSAYERSRISQLSDRVIEIYCVCPFEVASSRYSARARSGQHHPVHVLRDLDHSIQSEYDGPVGIGTVIEVDTTNPVDPQSLARQIAPLLA